MENEQITVSRKITVGLILSWFLGIIFAINGFARFFSEPVYGFIMLFMAAILLPPVNKLVDDKWKIHLSSGLKVIIIIICFTISGFILSNSKTDKEQNNQPQASQETAPSVSAQQEEQKPVVEQPKTTDSEKTAQPEKTEVTPTISEEKVTPAKETAVPAEYESALNKATTYANVMNMSKKGVYDQLVSNFDKFSAAAAQYAIDNVEADWNANALSKAKTYQDVMSMSPAAIRTQLTSKAGEKFTKAEADYAIQHLND